MQTARTSRPADHPLTSTGTVELAGAPSLVAAADVAISITATPNPAPAGPVALQVHVRNDGPQTATGVGLTFELSQGIGDVHADQGSCHDAAAHVTECALGSIAPGREVVVTFGTNVTGTEEGLFATGTISSSQYDPDLADHTATIEVLIEGGTTS